MYSPGLPSETRAARYRTSGTLHRGLVSAAWCGFRVRDFRPTHRSVGKGSAMVGSSATLALVKEVEVRDCTQAVAAPLFRHSSRACARVWASGRLFRCLACVPSWHRSTRAAINSSVEIVESTGAAGAEAERESLVVAVQGEPVPVDMERLAGKGELNGELLSSLLERDELNSRFHSALDSLIGDSRSGSRPMRLRCLEVPSVSDKREGFLLCRSRRYASLSVHRDLLSFPGRNRTSSQTLYNVFMICACLVDILKYV